MRHAFEIHHEDILGDVVESNEKYINEYLSDCISSSKKNLLEMSALMKEKLGIKALNYQDVSDFFPESPKSEKKERKLYSKKRRFRSFSGKNASASPQLSALDKLGELVVGDIPQTKGMIQSMERSSKKKKSKNQFYLAQTFQRNKNLLESLWKEMHVSKFDQNCFKRLTFYPVSLSNYILIYREIVKLLRIRKIQHSILKNIETREVMVERLLEFSRKEAAYNAIFINELNSLIKKLRSCTINIVLRVLDWRDSLPRMEVFKWKGKNYFLKMQSDLNFLNHYSLFGKLVRFSVIDNPLLLPRNFRCELFRGKMKKSNKNDNNIGTEEYPPPYFLSSKYFQSIQFHEVRKIEQVDEIIFSEKSYLTQISNLQKLETAAVKIQKIVRGFLARKRVLKIKRLREKNKILQEIEKKKNREMQIRDERIRRRNEKRINIEVKDYSYINHNRKKKDFAPQNGHFTFSLKDFS